MVRKFSLLFFAFVVVVSLSFSAFATGEQPSGDSYVYYNGSSVSYSTFWNATSFSLRYIGSDLRWMRQNWPSFVNNWSQSYVEQILSDVRTIKTDLDLMEDYNQSMSSDIADLRQSNNSISSFVSSISSDTSNIESDTSNIQSDTSSISGNTSRINNNMNTLLSRLGTPSSGSTFWSNQSAIKDDFDTLIHRTSNLELEYKYFDSNGHESSGRYMWFSAMIASLRNLGLATERFHDDNNAYLDHIDDDFHDMHDKIGNPIDSGSTIFSLLTDLHTVFASPEDLELHNNNSQNVSDATDSFFTGRDSSISIGSNSLYNLKEFGASAGDFFASDEDSPMKIFSYLSAARTGSDQTWEWFTSTTRSNLNSSSNNRLRSSRSDEYIDIYSEHEEEYYSMLGSDVVD